MGVGSELADDVGSLRYSRGDTQRVTTGAVGFLRGYKGLQDEVTEVRCGTE